jgi:hypothetical protein
MNEKLGLEPGFFALLLDKLPAALRATRCSRYRGLAGAMVFAMLSGLVLSIIFVSAPTKPRRLLPTLVLTHSTLLEASPFFGGSTAVLGMISKLIRRTGLASGMGGQTRKSARLNGMSVPPNPAPA